MPAHQSIKQRFSLLRSDVPWICCRTDIDAKCGVKRASPCLLTDIPTLGLHHESSRILLKPAKEKTVKKNMKKKKWFASVEPQSGELALLAF